MEFPAGAIGGLGLFPGNAPQWHLQVLAQNRPGIEDGRGNPGSFLPRRALAGDRPVAPNIFAMRNLLWLCLALLSISRLTAALPADERLKELASALPSGWAISMDQHKLELFRKEEVYVISENRINAPFSRETSQQLGEKMRKFGKRGGCRCEYRLDQVVSSNHGPGKHKNAEISTKN